MVGVDGSSPFTPTKQQSRAIHNRAIAPYFSRFKAFLLSFVVYGYLLKSMFFVGIFVGIKILIPTNKANHANRYRHKTVKAVH